LGMALPSKTQEEGEWTISCGLQSKTWKSTYCSCLTFVAACVICWSSRIRQVHVATVTQSGWDSRCMTSSKWEICQSFLSNMLQSKSFCWTWLRTSIVVGDHCPCKRSKPFAPTSLVVHITLAHVNLW
jgi:hypothetical protein